MFSFSWIFLVSANVYLMIFQVNCDYVSCACSTLIENLLQHPWKTLAMGKAKLHKVIDDLELKDLALHGGDFTWAEGPGNQRMVRLDKFLISDEWENYFGTVNKKNLPKPFSNNFLILLTGGGSIVRGPLPFRFENMWLKVEGFKNLIDVWWKGMEVRGANSYVVEEKQKAIKLKLKCWNKEVFKRVDERKNQALQNLAF